MTQQLPPHDAQCFYAADPEGFLIAELKGEHAGCVSAVRYADGFGFIGFYIMRPELRGKGLGAVLGRAAVDRLANLNAGLDGVLQQQSRYETLWGFKLAHRNVRYELGGSGSAASAGPRTEAPLPSSVRIESLAEVPFPKLAEYDLEMFRFEREAFLRSWISQPDAVALGAVRDGDLTGYGVIRPCRNGFKIAPLFADSPEIAEALFCELAVHAGAEPVYLDIPQVNPAALALVGRHGMTPVFETVRMYTKGDPGLPLDRIFGITSFELG